MLARVSYRWITVIVAALLFTSLLALLNSWENSNSRYKPSLLVNGKKAPGTPPAAITDFWAGWAATFDKARPKIKKIEVKKIASKEGSDKAAGERKPSKDSLGLPQQDVDSLHKSHKIVLDRLRRSQDQLRNATSTLYFGRGIVIVAGGPYFAPALVSIRMLRRTKSKLPIQVFLQSQSEYEPEVCESVLPALGAECFIIESYLRKKSPVKITHYQLKVMAILFSSFKEILFLDSDCIPLRKPIELFDSEPYKSKALVTWPDYWIATEDPIFYTIAGMTSFPPGLPARASESGQLLINKEIHLPTLLLATYYNIFGPDTYYPILSQGVDGMGDKETFLAAAAVLNLPFYAVKEHVGTIGYFKANKEFQGGAMVQHSPVDDFLPHNSTTKPAPFFLHANVPKMNVGFLLDRNLLIDPTAPHKENQPAKPIRLWGNEANNKKLGLGKDIEKAVWREMVDLACELQYVLKDWRERGRVCERAQEHWKAVFEEKPKVLAGIV